eukprot:UN14042
MFASVITCIISILIFSVEIHDQYSSFPSRNFYIQIIACT